MLSLTCICRTSQPAKPEDDEEKDVVVALRVEVSLNGLDFDCVYPNKLHRGAPLFTQYSSPLVEAVEPYASVLDGGAEIVISGSSVKRFTEPTLVCFLRNEVTYSEDELRKRISTKGREGAIVVDATVVDGKCPCTLGGWEGRSWRGER